MSTEPSPRALARTAGAMYVVTFVGAAGLAVNGRLIVPTDAAATAANLLAHERLFRLGWLAGLVSTFSYVAVTALFYLLFRPVSRTLSLVAAAFSLVGIASWSVAATLQLAPLVLLKRAAALGGWSVEQVQSLALAFLKLADQSPGIVFFGVYCALIGILVLRSTFLPRVLGVLMLIGGLGWLTFAWGPLSRMLYPYNLAPGVLGEGALTLWLVVMAVDAARWRQQAAA